ncbi:MAG: hypothetical protein JWM68_3193 [Verrucomicrobiales bacterium]|nr:hypothetical protein [Verrucomicrobiales bacterium]
MIVIYNWRVIPVGLAIVAVALGLEQLAPSLMRGPHGILAVGVITTVVGGITEACGFSGRLFFLPVWLIGLGIVCFQFHWITLIIFAILTGIIFYFINRAGKVEAIEPSEKTEADLSSASSVADLRSKIREKLEKRTQAEELTRTPTSK